MLKELQQSLKKEVPKARNIIKQIFGEDIILHRTINGHLEAEVSANAMEMFGFPTNARIGLVAGTGDSTYSQSRIGLVAGARERRFSLGVSLATNEAGSVVKMQIPDRNAA